MMDYRKVMAGASVCALLALGTGSARAQENVAIEPGSSEPAPLVEEGWELPGIFSHINIACLSDTLVLCLTYDKKKEPLLGLNLF